MPLLFFVALALAEPLGPLDGAAPVEDEPIELGPPIASGATSSTRPFARWSEHLVAPLHPTTSPWSVSSTLTLGLAWDREPDWSIAVEGRLRHRVAAALASLDLPPGAADPIAGRFTPELRRAVIRWRPGPELAVGLDRLRLGRSQLARPLDRLNPSDWREGLLGPEGGERRPVPLVSVRNPLGRGELLLAWVPFFVPLRLPMSPAHRSSLELAPISPLLDAVSGPGALLAEGDDLGALGPNADLRDSELALRWTQRLGDLDLALTWLYQRDRLPNLAAPTQRAHQHVLGLDLAVPIGPVRAVAEAAVILAQRNWLASPGLPTARHPMVHATLEAAVSPAIFLDLTVGLEALVTLDAPGSTGFVFGGPRDLWLTARMNLLLAFDGILRLDAETRLALTRDDQLTSLVFGARLATDLELSLGLALFGGNPMDGGLGGLYESRDSLWLRAVFEL